MHYSSSDNRMQHIDRCCAEDAGCCHRRMSPVVPAAGLQHSCNWCFCALDCLLVLLMLLLLQVIGKLVGNHKASISCLLTLPSKAHFKTQDEQQQHAAGSQRDRAGRHKQQQQDRAAPLTPPSPAEFVPSVDLVFGGDSAGGLYVWEPFRVPLGSADREVGPKVTMSGHSGEVWAACLTPGPEDPQAAAAKIFTAGAQLVDMGATTNWRRQQQQQQQWDSAGQPEQ
jgi:hypothetical protein